MTPDRLFYPLADRIAPMLLVEFGRRDLCVLATRVAMDVGAYFGIQIEPVAVQVVLYNAKFAESLKTGNPAGSFEDGGHSVGIGFGLPKGAPAQEGRWNGHLIAAAAPWFGDFAISQAERPHRDIVTGTGIVGPYSGAEMWQAIHETGTVVEYRRIEDRSYRRGPDWRDPVRRRKIVAALIRSLKESCLQLLA